jgi:hypothetical protein
MTSLIDGRVEPHQLKPVPGQHAQIKLVVAERLLGRALVAPCVTPLAVAPPRIAGFDLVA